MTSEERREARYKRRKAKREERARAHLKRMGYCSDYVKVFQQNRLRRAYIICRRGIKWKRIVQRYILRSPILIARTSRMLLTGMYKFAGFDEFDLVERGKLRHIKAVKFSDRIVQRCFCDNALGPAVTRSFIYDNGASMEGKGYHFSMDRLKCHLQRHYRKHGREGYILLFDFSKFFDNVSHPVIMDLVRKAISDHRSVNFVQKFIDLFGERGLGLGSQISQILALASANDLDHYIKDRERIKEYARYMDDGYAISEDKGTLINLRSGMQTVCRKLGIVLNETKTMIVKLSHGFTWMKARWYLTDTGKVIKKIYKKSVVRMRRKIKKFPGLIAQEKLDFEHANQAFQSWMGYAKHFHANHSRHAILKLWEDLFANYLPAASDDRKARKQLNIVMRGVRRVNKSETISEKNKAFALDVWKKYAHRVEKSYALVNLQEEWQQLTNMLERKAA